ncbi:hypothetical protein [Flavobacterium sp.]|uniref:hypothetical protein n=1 Tax=Flavobacterium sp. TaxID=239 RepID=UPI003751578B
MKKIKFGLGVILIIVGFGGMFKDSFFGGALLSLLGVLLLPPISEQIKKKFSFWQGKTLRYATYIILFLVSAGLMNKNGLKPTDKMITATDEQGNVIVEVAYQEYITQTEKEVAGLSADRKQQRAKWLNELSKNSIYIQLVNNKIVSVDYLPTLTAISDAIKNSNVKNGESEFGISDKIAESVESSSDGKNKMQFVVDVSLLSLKMNGGLPKKIVAVFDRYRTKYNLYSEEAKIYYNTSGKSENLKNWFNITYTFAILDPKDKKVLDGIYETNFSDIGSWSDDDTIFDYPYMINKVAYLQHLKSNNSDSKYLPKMNDIDVWDEFGADVKTRIEMMIFNKDCDALQQEFNAADENIKRFHNAGRNSNKHSELMGFVDEQMRDLGCYK